MQNQPTASARNGQAGSFADLLAAKATPSLKSARPAAAKSTADAPAAEFSLITSTGNLTKTFTVDADGKIAKRKADALYQGVATRCVLSAIPAVAVEQMRQILARLTSCQAIICAPPPAGRGEWVLTTKEHQSPADGRISRSQESFAPAIGPAIFGMDFDTSEFPEELKEKLRAAGNLTSALSSTFDGFTDAATLIRNSSSAAVAFRNAKPINSGHHRYFIVPDGRDIADFAQRLRDRLMLEGYLWGKITETGAILERTLFDFAASSDTSRLFYEADPIIEDDRLQVVERRIQTKAGGFLNTELLPALTDEERSKLRSMTEKLKQDLAPIAEEKRTAYQARRVAELISRGTDPAVAQKAVTGAIEQHLLPPEWEIFFDDGTCSTVSEILANPVAFNGKTCADPLEPDYNGGRAVAKLMTAYDPFVINSFAHGGIRYDLNSSARHLTNLNEGADDAQSEPVPKAEGWPEPVDIFGDASPLELGTPPKGALPDVIERWSDSQARRKGVSPAFAAASAITVCAAAVGNSLTIQPRIHDDGWNEPAGLWTVLVADPGSAKSPTIAAAVKPLRDLDAKRRTAIKPRHDAWLTMARKKGANAPDPGPEPKAARALIDDITAEEQIKLHAANPRGLFRVTDEYMALLGSLGAYKNGADGDRSQMLRMFDGDAITVDRVKAGSLHASSSLTSILAGTQPDKISRLVRDLTGDGLCQRTIFIMDDGVSRRGIDEAPDAFAMREYNAMVQGLAEFTCPFPKPTKLSPDAYKVLSDATDRIAALGQLPGASPAWRGHVQKWGKLLPRLMLTFHAIEMWCVMENLNPEVPVGKETAERAVLFARFLLRHSLTFYQRYFGSSADADEARWIAGHLLVKSGVDDISRRDLQRARKNLDRRGLLSAMGQLESMGWFAVAERDADGPKRWKINPQIHTRFQGHAERERTERAYRREEIMRAGETRKNWLSSDNLSEGGDQEDR